MLFEICNRYIKKNKEEDLQKEKLEKFYSEYQSAMLAYDTYNSENKTLYDICHGIRPE